MLFVGLGRFELPTSCLSSMRSKPTELIPLIRGKFNFSAEVMQIIEPNILELSASGQANISEVGKNLP